jgi:hypothetical protein
METWVSNMGCQHGRQLTEMKTAIVDRLSVPHTKNGSLTLLEYIFLIFTEWQLWHKFVTTTNPHSLALVCVGMHHFSFCTVNKPHSLNSMYVGNHDCNVHILYEHSKLNLGGFHLMYLCLQQKLRLEYLYTCVLLTFKKYFVNSVKIREVAMPQRHTYNRIIMLTDKY